MKNFVSEAKTLEIALNQLLEKNNLELDDILYNKEIIKSGILRSENYKVTAFLKKDLVKEIEKFLKEKSNSTELIQEIKEIFIIIRTNSYSKNRDNSSKKKLLKRTIKLLKKIR